MLLVGNRASVRAVLSFYIFMNKYITIIIVLHEMTVIQGVLLCTVMAFRLGFFFILMFDGNSKMKTFNSSLCTMYKFTWGSG